MGHIWPKVRISLLCCLLTDTILWPCLCKYLLPVKNKTKILTASRETLRGHIFNFDPRKLKILCQKDLTNSFDFAFTTFIHIFFYTCLEGHPGHSCNSTMSCWKEALSGIILKYDSWANLDKLAFLEGKLKRQRSEVFRSGAHLLTLTLIVWTQKTILAGREYNEGNLTNVHQLWGKNLTWWIEIMEVVGTMLFWDDARLGVVPTQPAIPGTITHGL